jgi:hypothetical protein
MSSYRYSTICFAGLKDDYVWVVHPKGLRPEKQA